MKGRGEIILLYKGRELLVRTGRIGREKMLVEQRLCQLNGLLDLLELNHELSWSENISADNFALISWWRSRLRAIFDRAFVVALAVVGLESKSHRGIA